MAFGRNRRPSYASNIEATEERINAIAGDLERVRDDFFSVSQNLQGIVGHLSEITERLRENDNQ